MKILVTGGAGFIGRWLVKTLLNNDNQVVVVDDLSNGRIENISEFNQTDGFEFFRGDIQNEEFIKDSFQTKMELYDEKISRIDEKITGHIETHEQQEEIHRHQESLFWIKVGIVVAIVIPIIISLVSLYYTFNPP